MERIKRLMAPEGGSLKPPGVPEEEWDLSWKALQATMQSAEKLVRRHQRRFNVANFYRTADACKAANKICSAFRAFVERWWPVMAAAGELPIRWQYAGDVCGELPDSCEEGDRRDLDIKLGYILKGNYRNTFDGMEWPMREWQEVKAEHDRRFETFTIIEEHLIEFPRLQQPKDAVQHGTWRGTKVTIKRVVAECNTMDLEDFAKFLTELDIVSKVQFPHVVQCFGATLSGKLVMERSETDLAAWLETPRTLLARLEAMLHAALGLDYVHDMKVVHQGVSSHSFYVYERQDGRVDTVKILDFSSAVDKTKVLSATPHQHSEVVFLDAPEVLFGEKPHSYMSDVFRFAIVMFEIVSQLPAYGSATAPGNRLKQREQGKEPCPISNDCPDELAKLMRKCYSTKPEDRSSIKDVCTVLKRLVQEYSQAPFEADASSLEQKENLKDCD